MSAEPERPATLKDLARVRGKAELIGGRIVMMRPSGEWPGLVAGNILFALHDHAEAIGRGEVYGSTLAYAIPRLPSGRESFSPDTSYYDGPFPDDPMAFIQGPPTLAVEVREEEDFGPEAEAAMAAKRADHFAAGTLVVWDVDPVAERIHSYRADDPDHPVTYRYGDVAEAEPAVPGWRVPVDDLFA